MSTPYFTIELVRPDLNGTNRYHLLTKVFGGWRKAESKFEYLAALYPLERVELNHTNWVNTVFGFAPIAYSN